MKCFCGMVDQWQTLSLISIQDQCHRFSMLQISHTPQAGFEPTQNLISGFIEWSCAVVVKLWLSLHHSARLNVFRFNINMFFNSFRYFAGFAAEHRWQNQKNVFNMCKINIVITFKMICFFKLKNGDTAKLLVSFQWCIQFKIPTLF